MIGGNSRSLSDNLRSNCLYEKLFACSPTSALERGLTPEAAGLLAITLRAVAIAYDSVEKSRLRRMQRHRWKKSSRGEKVGHSSATKSMMLRKGELQQSLIP